jgi:hypothetical protein
MNAESSLGKKSEECLFHSSVGLFGSKNQCEGGREEQGDWGSE